MKPLFFIFCCLAMPAGLMSMPTDSIGTEIDNGMVYTLHRVQKGETLFGIARKYQAKASDVFIANPGSEDGIMANAVLRIPRGKSGSVPTPSAPPILPPKAEVDRNEKTTPPPSSIPLDGSTKDLTKFHEVKPGETLYRISQMYGVEVNDIKQWNQLKGDAISVGQKIQVSPLSAVSAHQQNTQTEKTPPRQPEPTNRDNREPVQVKTAPVTPPTEVKTNDKQAKMTNAELVKGTVEGAPTEEKLGVSVPSRQVRTLGDELIETGKVSISNDGEMGQDRNFILHPNAKIGTIVMITNVDNGKSSFARVVGNQKITADQVAVVNQKVADKLGIQEKSHTIRINYAK
jgi:LysM repeat protein